MEFVIDIEAFIDFFARPLGDVLTDLFFGGGWVVLVLILFALVIHFWRDYLEGKVAAGIDYVILAVDVPRENEQALKAVEQLFAHLAGAHENKPKFLDKYWKGFFQPSFSFEIVSLEGYVQFLIRTPVAYQDLIKASLYAQYPDAEVTEISDYTHDVPHHFPNENWDMWGSELVLAKEEAYPLRTHINFEDKLSGYFKDPMSAILEVLSSLGDGEQMWLQFVVTPCDQEKWKEKSENLVKELIGEEEEHSESFVVKVFKLPLTVIDELIKAVFPPGEHEDKKEKPKNLLQYLTPGKKDIVAAIEDKESKVGHEVKIRLVYLAERAAFVKARRVGALLGSFTQFSTLNLNGFKTGKVKTKSGTFFAARGLAKSQNSLLHAYTSRSHHGDRPFVLNIEELATIWHFPLATVKAPLVMKTETKKGEPPFRLPVVDEKGRAHIHDLRQKKSNPLSHH